MAYVKIMCSGGLIEQMVDIINTVSDPEQVKTKIYALALAFIAEFKTGDDIEESSSILDGILDTLS